MENQDNYNPLASPVIEKSYSTGSLPTGQQERIIPEATYTPPPPDMNPIPQKEPSKATEQKPAAPKAPFNPDIAQLSEGDKNEAAAHLAVTVVNMYEIATNACNRLLLIPERKIRKMQMEGEIDLTVPIPYNKSQFIPLQEFIEEYNITAADTMTVDDDFKKEVIPVLTRVLQKRGHGMTDEQKLAYLFVTHAGQNGFRFLEMKAQTKQIMEFAREQTIAGRSRPIAPVINMNQVRHEEAMHNTQFQSPNQPAHEGSIGEQPPPPPPPPQTLQEKIMQEHTAKMHGDTASGMGVNVNPNHNGINQQTGLPQFGDTKVLTTIAQAQEQEAKEKQRIEKNRKILDGRVPKRKRIPTKSKKPLVPTAAPVKKANGRPRKDSK